MKGVLQKSDVLSNSIFGESGFLPGSPPRRQLRSEQPTCPLSRAAPLTGQGEYTHDGVALDSVIVHIARCQLNPVY
jgi:hypothetical protein